MRFIKLIFLCLVSGTAVSGESDSSITDYQTRKEIYSNLFGFEIDTIYNEELYRTIGEWMYTSYKYGGKSKDGIDCSDFTSTCYENAYNIKLQGSSASMFNEIEPIKKEELCEGDLVFFKIKKTTISHVGVYLTQNKFAHSTVKAGVIISDLNETYYRKYYYKGGRLPADGRNILTEK